MLHDHNHWPLCTLSPAICAQLCLTSTSNLTCPMSLVVDPLKVCLDGGARDDLIIGPMNAKLSSSFRVQVIVVFYKGAMYLMAPFDTPPLPPPLRTLIICCQSSGMPLWLRSSGGQLLTSSSAWPWPRGTRPCLMPCLQKRHWRRSPMPLPLLQPPLRIRLADPPHLLITLISSCQQHASIYCTS